jgi:hypothetical protein
VVPVEQAEREALPLTSCDGILTNWFFFIASQNFLKEIEPISAYALFSSHFPNLAQVWGCVKNKVES